MVIKKILVALDLSEIDNRLIEYAAFLANELALEKVYFIHNIRKYAIGDLFEEELKDVNLDEVIGDELNEQVATGFKSDTPWEVLISEDTYTESLISYIANKYSIDLMLLGNKNNVKGTGQLTGKLIRMLKCPVLSLPASSPIKLEQVWVGTDFSTASEKSFRYAFELSKEIPLKLSAVHVYNLPLQFAPYVPQESMVLKVEKHVQEKFSRFIKRLKYDKEIKPVIIPGRDATIAEKIIEKANRSGVDLLIVSDKGENTFSHLIIGSVADDLFDQELNVPLMIVK
ncbi:MAG: universal stress protein [Chitinophagales bacterium]